MEPEYPAHTFADPEGRRWSLVVNNGVRRNLKEQVGLDIGKLLEKHLEPLLVVDGDNDKLLDAVWLCIESQAAGLNRETFADSWTGDTFAEARGALYEAIVLFSPPHHREPLRKMLTMCETVATRVGLEAMEAIDVDSIVADLMKKAGDLQASAESIPTAIH
jgi:hypothetical protein